MMSSAWKQVSPNIFFTAADKNKRLRTLKQEDIRILEDGKPQEIFTFTEYRLAPVAAILIARVGPRSVPSPTKSAARTFLET